MVVLDYELSPSWNRGVGVADLRAADETKLRYDCFLGDAILLVDEVDLSARWGWVPILDFALGLRSIVTAPAAEDAQVFEFTESDATLVFENKSGKLAIRASYADGEAVVDPAEFAHCVERFFARVAGDLGAAYPGLRDNPFFAELVRGSGLLA